MESDITKRPKFIAGKHCCLTSAWDHFSAKVTEDKLIFWDIVCAGIKREVSVTSDDINVTATYVA
jgi:hypothetical protein